MLVLPFIETKLFATIVEAVFGTGGKTKKITGDTSFLQMLITSSNTGNNDCLTNYR